MSQSAKFENTIEKENIPTTSPKINHKSFIKRPEERFSVYSHLLGAILTAIGTIFLVIKSYGDPSKIIVSIIYGTAVTLLFIASTICHSQKISEDHIFFWTRIDQIAIFFMIAGTYTPISYLYDSGHLYSNIISLPHWSLANWNSCWSVDSCRSRVDFKIDMDQFSTLGHRRDLSSSRLDGNYSWLCNIFVNA